jgi:hypothetical protein
MHERDLLPYLPSVLTPGSQMTRRCFSKKNLLLSRSMRRSPAELAFAVEGTLSFMIGPKADLTTEVTKEDMWKWLMFQGGIGRDLSAVKLKLNVEQIRSGKDCAELAEDGIE